MADEQLQADGQGAQATEADGLRQLLHKTAKIKTTESKDLADRAVETLAGLALKEAVTQTDDAVATIKSIIARLDQRMSDQINLILHHEDYRKLEGTWRGLNHLVSNTETDTTLKIRVMNISKKDLGKTLKKFKGTMWDQSPIFDKIYSSEYGRLGGEPYGCLVGDYHFDHTQPDVNLLGEMSKIAAASHAPFITGASSDIFRMDSFQELQNPVSLAKTFQDPAYASWNSLRSTEDAKYLGLAMPRFLARPPYGAKSEPVDEFDFEEQTGPGDHDKYSWSNAAYAMAVNINRAFKLYGWCAKIRGVEGGAVEGLPVDTFPTDDGDTDMKCPTEIGITNRREKELADCGFMPLIHKKNTDFAAFIGAQSLRKPDEYDDPDATANENLAARLPYLFASCRFAHYLNKMVYDMVGNFTSRTELERFLDQWINRYVLADPDNAPERRKAEKPLQKAEVKVVEDETNPGYYSAKFSIVPHYQLEGVAVTMSLVAKVPSQKE